MTQQQHPAPTSADEGADLARASVEAAKVATLVAYGRHPSAQTATVVAVAARPDGSVEVRLATDAPAVRQLLARPLATVSLALPAGPPVLLHGAAHRLPGVGADGRVVFHVEAGAVRVGELCRPVDVRAYAASRPGAADVLRALAPAALSHLNAAHGAALADRLRADGRHAEVALATRLDARELTVAALDRSGVRTVRLPFAAPLERAEHLPAALAALLTSRCSCDR